MITPRQDGFDYHGEFYAFSDLMETKHDKCGKYAIVGIKGDERKWGAICFNLKHKDLPTPEGYCECKLTKDDKMQMIRQEIEREFGILYPFDESIVSVED